MKGVHEAMKIRFIVLIYSVLILVAGCSNNIENGAELEEFGETEETNEGEREESDQSNFPVTIKLDGKEIIIKEKPEKIIPLSLEVAEIVLELVDPSRVVAATRGIDDEKLSTKSNISGAIPNRIAAAANIDPEEIISYESDLLLLTKMFGQEEDADKILSQLDTPILTFDSIVKVEQFMDVMEVIGLALGEQQKAESIVAKMKEEIGSIQEQIPEDETPSVLVLSEVGGDMGPFMLGPTNISYDLIQLAGAIPAVDHIDLKRSTPASMEQIIKTDPDYIILLDFFGRGEQSFADLMEDPGWETLAAVENDRIKLVDAKYMLNPNVENVTGLKMIVDWIYGDVK